MKRPTHVDINLLTCKQLYEDHFKQPLPGDLPYIHAAAMVKDAVGWDEFLRRVAEIKKQQED